MNLTKFLCAALLSCTLFACGDPDPKTLVKQGYEELNSGNSDAALAKFNAALKQLKQEDAQYLDARMGVVEAQIAHAPKQAVEDFLKLAKEFPGKIGEKQFINTSGKMISAHQYMDAIDLVHNGIKLAGGESPALLVFIDRIKKEAANDKGVNDKLHSLGYL